MRQANEATPEDVVGAGGQKVYVQHRADTLQRPDLHGWAAANLPSPNLHWGQMALPVVPCDQPCD